VALPVNSTDVVHGIHSESATIAKKTTNRPARSNSGKMALAVGSVEDTSAAQRAIPQQSLRAKPSRGQLFSPSVQRVQSLQPLCPRPGCSPSEWLASTLRFISSEDHPGRGHRLSIQSLALPFYLGWDHRLSNESSKSLSSAVRRRVTVGVQPHFESPQLRHVMQPSIMITATSLHFVQS